MRRVSLTEEQILVAELKHLLPPKAIIVDKLMDWIREDIPGLDVSATIVGNSRKRATMFFKKRSNEKDTGNIITLSPRLANVEDSVIVAGIPILTILFEDCFSDLSVKWLVKEGENVSDDKVISNLIEKYGQSCKYPEKSKCSKRKVPIAVVEGPAYQILQAERLALNILSHLSGIATISSRVDKLRKKELINGGKFKGEIAATRKTTPGLRLFEKYAVMIGGCKPHRTDLSQMVMLKDNHIDACYGSITHCVKLAKKVCGLNSQKIEVECRSLQDAREAAQSGADIVMLDNFTPEMAKEASDILVKEYPNIIIEVSGGINLETIIPYLRTCDNVHVLSMGILTEGSAIPVDFSMKITENAEEEDGVEQEK
ncbi:hypothetical protein ABK040_014869 [Willaertia magna]